MNPYVLPDNLPEPIDDGAADHLPGRGLPPIALPATTGGLVRLGDRTGRSIVFGYPRTAPPGVAMPADWDDIPGARGCTPQACAIRDALGEFTTLGTRVYGLSTQDPAEQAEAATRLRLGYPLLADPDLALTIAMDLPRFTVEGRMMVRRQTLILRDGVVEAVLYPVFPSDRAAEQALSWLRDHPMGPTPAPRRGRPIPIPRRPER